MTSPCMVLHITEAACAPQTDNGQSEFPFKGMPAELGATSTLSGKEMHQGQTNIPDFIISLKQTIQRLEK